MFENEKRIYNKKFEFQGYTLNAIKTTAQIIEVISVPLFFKNFENFFFLYFIDFITKNSFRHWYLVTNANGV